MNEIRQFFGKNLKRLRLQAGFTQEKLAEKIGINQRQLTRIETGRSFPSFATLDSLCNILGISADRLFNFSNYCETCKNGTDNTIYYVAQKSENNVILLKEKFPKGDIRETEIEEKDSYEVSDEQQMFRIAKNLSRPIFVEYFDGNKNFIKKVTYNPDGTSSVEIDTSKNDTLINEIIDDLNIIKPSLPKLRFIKLAMQCLNDKSSIIKMQNVLEGMAL